MRFALLPLVCTILSSVVLPPAGTAAETRGWRGDGNGVFLGATPPGEWKSPDVNILWKRELPTWGHAAPVVVDGRVVTTTEPYQMLCLDADSGEIMWQVDLDQFAFMPEDKAAEGRALLAEEQAALDALQDWSQKVAAFRDELDKDTARSKAWNRAFEDGQEVAEDDLPDDPALAQKWRSLAAEGRANGFSFRRTGADLNRKGDAAVRERTRRPGNEFAAWYEVAERGWNTITGRSFATPVTDGERIYVSFANDVVACYDLDGERVWARWDHKPRETRGDDPGTRRELHYTASPIIVGDLLVVAGGENRLRAYALADGEKQWESPYPDTVKNLAGTPVVTRLAYGAVIVAPNGHVYRAGDGTVLAKDLPGCPSGASPAVADDLVIMLPGKRGKGDLKGMVALRLTMSDADSLDWKRVWAVEGDMESTRAPAIHDGLLYQVRGRKTDRLAVFDLASGEQLTEIDLGVRERHISLSLGGDLLVTKGTGDAMCLIKAGRQPEVVSTNELDIDKGDRNYALPCLDADRIYVRSKRYIYCIGAQ
ncbi:MAG: PQQ-binding-like beta-propeller repeat protein [Planctomycetota bacterium]